VSSVAVGALISIYYNERCWPARSTRIAPVRCATGFGRSRRSAPCPEALVAYLVSRFRRHPPVGLAITRPRQLNYFSNPPIAAKTNQLLPTGCGAPKIRGSWRALPSPEGFFFPIVMGAF